MTAQVSEVERYVAAMVLSGVGDAIGFKNGGWEFCHSGHAIHDECKALGGVKNLKVKLPNFRVSDDTVMHLATAEAFMNTEKVEPCMDKLKLYIEIATQYKASMKDMQGRSAGFTCRGNSYALEPHKPPKGIQIPFDESGGGCGAAMRAMCIGLRYPRPDQLDDLIAVSIEAGRLTHHHPTGYLGSLAAALFTSYAIQGKPLKEWGASLVQLLPKALEYVKKEGRYVEENVETWPYFEKRWKEYLTERQITDGTLEPVFPERFDVEERDAFYKKLSFDGWGGASGHDAPMIAYDALLGCGGSWEELIKRGALHAGDSDSTAVVACACYGAMYGFTGVPECNHKKLEYRDRLETAGKWFYEMSQKP